MKSGLNNVPQFFDNELTNPPADETKERFANQILNQHFEKINCTNCNKFYKPSRGQFAKHHFKCDITGLVFHSICKVDPNHFRCSAFEAKL